MNENLPVIGWREWVQLPDLDIPSIKAKVDSGARSSSIHAPDIETFPRNGRQWVRFSVAPDQKDATASHEVESKILEHRYVKSSNGEVTLRPVIVTRIRLLGKTFHVELTLADRSEMGFRMLLGREAFRGKFLVDASRSYLGGKRKRKKKTKPPEQE